jgi:hypothetical protein
MFNTDDAPSIPESAAPAQNQSEETGRREFLRQLAMAGAGAAALTLLGPEPTRADPVTTALAGRYLVNHNFALNYMGIESQDGNSFSGRFDDGSHFTGCYFGAAANTGIFVMSRTLADGSGQLFIGTASSRPAGAIKDVILSGTFYREGSGPLPWFATGSVHG